MHHLTVSLAKIVCYINIRNKSIALIPNFDHGTIVLDVTSFHIFIQMRFIFPNLYKNMVRAKWITHFFKATQISIFRPNGFIKKRKIHGTCNFISVFETSTC